MTPLPIIRCSPRHSTSDIQLIRCPVLPLLRRGTVYQLLARCRVRRFCHLDIHPVRPAGGRLDPISHLLHRWETVGGSGQGISTVEDRLSQSATIRR